MRQNITLSVGGEENPTTMQVEADVCEGLAVHRSVGDQFYAGEERWVVTHVRSGRCLAKFGNLEQATAVMNILIEEDVDWVVHDHASLVQLLDGDPWRRLQELIKGQHMTPGDGRSVITGGSTMVKR